MSAVIWLCLYLCTIIPLIWCAETPTETPATTSKDPDQTSTADKKHLPPSPDDGAKKIVMRITIVLFIVCVIVGLYFIWRCTKSRPNVRTKAGGNNYRRVRSSMPAGDMGGERGEDGEDEETLYDRTESTSQF